MHIAYLVITVVAALIYGYAASLNFVGAESVKIVADRVHVSQKWMIPFGVLLSAGAGGLLLGLVVPALGIAATGLRVHEDEVVGGTGLLEGPANPSRAARSFAVVETRHRVDHTGVHI
jgi:hypothetical protein